MNQLRHIGMEIHLRLKAQERSVAWLARKISCDHSNLSRQLKCSHIHAELLYRISIAMKENFFTVYAQWMSEDLEKQGKNNHESE